MRKMIAGVFMMILYLGLTRPPEVAHMSGFVIFCVLLLVAGMALFFWGFLEKL